MSITEERSDKGAKNRCPTNQQGTAMPTRSAARRPDRRRRAAVAFLSNISLDGRPLAGLPCSSPFPTPIADDRSPQEFGVSDGCPLLAASSLQAPVQHSLTPMAQFGPAMEGATPIGFPEGPGSSQGGTFCRRLLSQQSSAETSEEPEDTPFPLRRSLQTTRSSAQQNLRRVHLIRTLRQHDTGNARIVLISAKRSFCTVFSVLPYRDPPTYGEIKGEGGRQRHPSSCTPSARDIVAGLEGVDVGADGKTVSYAQLLSPAYLPPCSMQTGPRTLQRLATLDMGTRVNPPLTETGAGLLEGLEPGEYDPTLLDNPQWLSGRHKRVLLFPSYMTTVVEYVRPADLKKGMNETFREKFPHIHLTLSKIRSLKRDMRRVALDDCGLEEAALAASYVHFEKLVLQARLEKSNRKLVAGVCLLLAAKTTCDLRRTEVKNLIDKLEERFRVNRRELIAFEFPVLVALQFGLHLPDNQVLPHYHRLTC